MPPETGCCSPAERATCCEPEAQEACCGEGHGSGCGCAAGHAGPVPTEDVHTVVRERYACAPDLAVVQVQDPR